LVPLGLIINELITNAVKYAFTDAKKGFLEVNLIESDGTLTVVVKDNGKGMDQAAMATSNSFGWTLIQMLSEKLQAAINISNDGGTTVQLVLSRYKLIV